MFVTLSLISLNGNSSKITQFSKALSKLVTLGIVKFVIVANFLLSLNISLHEPLVLILTLVIVLIGHLKKRPSELLTLGGITNPFNSEILLHSPKV